MKILFLATLFAYAFPIALRAQSSSISAEVQIARNSDPYHWFTYSHVGTRGFGPFAFVSNQAGITTFSPGIVYGTKIKKWYIEGAAGPGIDLAKGYANLSANGWVYLESKADESRTQGKVTVYANPYYSKQEGFWVMGYVMYSPIAWLSVGVHAQTEGVVGPRLQLNLPKGFEVWGAADSHVANVGITFSTDWQ